MSSNFSDGSLYLEIADLLQSLAVRDKSLRVTATGIASQLSVSSTSVAPLLVDAAKKHLLSARLVDRCEECGMEAEGVLDSSQVEGLADCLHCGRTLHCQYVLYEFTPALVAVAEKLRGPKAQRRRAPLNT